MWKFRETDEYSVGGSAHSFPQRWGMFPVGGHGEGGWPLSWLGFSRRLEEKDRGPKRIG